jgi:hypothetical protein
MLAIVSAVYASVRLFSGFSYYDDEGSLLMMSRWLLDGHSVYGDFSSIYGPFYFFYVKTAHTFFGASASHTATRLVAVVPWVLTCLVAFRYTLRVTGSRAAALLVWLAVLRTLAFLAMEPGHPQEICVLLLVGLVAVSARPHPARLAVCGALVAALALAKINLGVFAGDGLLLALVCALPPGRSRNLLLAGIGFVCVATPAILMRPLLDTAWVRESCVLLTLSILPVVLLLAAARQDTPLGWRHWRALALGFTACAALVLAWAVGSGASLGAMLRSTVLANLEQSHTWTVPLHLGIAGPAAGLIGASIASLWLAGVRGRALEWLRFAVGTSTLLLLIANRPQSAFTIALPFVWMVLLPGASAHFALWPRAVLAAVTAMQALSVYPVAGSQLRFSTVLVAIVAAQIAHDAWMVLRRDGAWTRLAIRRAEKAAIAFALAGYLFFVGGALDRYLRLPALDLPGTSGVHIDPDDRVTYHWVVSHARDSCDSLISFPAMHSVYFWTGMMPPVYPDVDGWQAYENADRQAVERRVLSSPRACVLVIDNLLPVWFPGNNTQATLFSFIHENFVEAARHEGFHFLVRKH